MPLKIDIVAPVQVEKVSPSFVECLYSLSLSVCVSVICSSEPIHRADIVPKINRLMLHRDQQEVSVAVPGIGRHRGEDWTTGDSSECQDTGRSSTTRQRRKFFCSFFYSFRFIYLFPYRPELLISPARVRILEWKRSNVRASLFNHVALATDCGP